MTKEQAATYLHNHKDILEIVLAGGGGISIFLTNLQTGLQILIALASLGYIIYKWHCLYIDRKRKGE